ncbi:ATP-binding protein [Pseudolysinimonas sp.]|uniref:ATP-binding protein n=1 Tax=Pseudolysinimonas sp. TaxID=2680009 RepID=UPI003F80A746
MRRRVRKLSSQIFLAQLVILTIATVVGFALFAAGARSRLDEEYQARAAAIAETVAQIPFVQDCMASNDPACQPDLQTFALATAKRTGASYVVLIDTQRIRHTHPVPGLIGQKVSEPIVALDGKVHLGTDNGATGVNANARVPLYSSARVLIGEVSVGITEVSVSRQLSEQLPGYALWFAVMFAIGTIASFAFARFLKRRTFGLELDEIARLLQEREATLHGIREGVVAVDPSGRLTVVNDEAERLLTLPAGATGRRVHDVVPAGAVRDILDGSDPLVDELLMTSDRWMIVNRMPVILDRRPHGVVVTVQDRTMLESLTRELAGERSFTESLRAQQHEFSNRLHAIAGLLELGQADEALRFVHEISGTAADLDKTLREHIASPQIVGLLLGKAAEAGERGITLSVDPDSRLGRAPHHVQALTTVLGNLIDNAFDALADTDAPRIVDLDLVETPQSVYVRVSDNGPGVDPDDAPHVFRNGFTTKRGSRVRHSGLGLHLVRTTVERLGGTVELSGGTGATFTVVIPTSDEASR